MNKLIFWLIFSGCIVILVCFLCGCATLRNFLQAEDETVAPTPGVQLWQAAKKSNWLVTFSILGIATGTFALVNGSVKLGIAAIASSSVALFATLAVARFALWMAVFGLIGSAAAALFSILARRRALVEIIKGVQNFKDVHDEDNLVQQDLRTELDNQSTVTKKIVGNIKNELKLQGKI